MTREQAKELLPIIQAFAEGKQIQDKIEEMTDWVDTDEINFEYEGQKIKHRIKPEPKYRPFESQEECWQEMHQHPDFGWVIRTGVYLNVFDVYGDAIHTPEDQHGIDFDDAFNELTFTDGTPFGIKEG